MITGIIIFNTVYSCFQLSSSAVARSWGVKLQTYLTSAPVEDKGVNIFGGLLETFTVAIFYCGISVGQLTVNIFTSAKVVLILFMIVVGFSLWVPGLAIAPAPSGYPIQWQYSHDHCPRDSNFSLSSHCILFLPGIIEQ